jgi:hypothetical protein
MAILKGMINSVGPPTNSSSIITKAWLSTHQGYLQLCCPNIYPKPMTCSREVRSVFIAGGVDSKLEDREVLTETCFNHRHLMDFAEF